MTSPPISLCAPLALLIAGCAFGPPRYSAPVIRESEKTLRLAPREPQFVRGKPNAFLDGLGHYLFGLPGKILLLNWSVDNHNISPETEKKLAQYLSDNNLKHVKVRLNQYNPGGEWDRLFANKEVGGGWRYTVGALSVLMYTLLPGRLLGGDNYNPYTNTVSMYSDLPVIAYHEGGHAKDFAQRKYKGTYALLGFLPLVPLAQEYVASDDAVEYTRSKKNTDEEKSAYRILYPTFMTYITGEIVQWIYIEPLSELALKFAAAAVGHVAGRLKAHGVTRRHSRQSAPDSKHFAAGH